MFSLPAALFAGDHDPYLTVSPDPASVNVGSTIQFTATYHFWWDPPGGGTNWQWGEWNVTNSGDTDWSSSDTSIATIDSSGGQKGDATGISGGTVTIQAEYNPDGPSNTVSDSATLTVIAPAPAVSVTKTADPTTANPGNTITYTITVENTGNVDFNDVTLTDSMLGLTDHSVGALSKGNSITLDPKPTYVVKTEDIGNLTNTVYVKGWYCCPPETRSSEGCFVEGDDSATVVVSVPATTTTTTVVTVAGIMDYNITASRGSGGSITDEGVTTVAEGASKTYMMDPDDGYEISDVMVDGVSVGAVESFAFTNVKADHTIYVDFGIIGQTEVAGITEEAAVEVLGVSEELPYTGMDTAFLLLGFAALALGASLLTYKLVRRSKV